MRTLATHSYLLAVNVPASSQPYLLSFCFRAYDEWVVAPANDRVHSQGSAPPVWSQLSGHPSPPHTRFGNADLRRGVRGTPQLIFVRDPPLWGSDSPGNDKPASCGVRQVLAHGGEILLRLQFAGYILPCSGDTVLTARPAGIVESFPIAVGVQDWSWMAGLKCTQPTICLHRVVLTKFMPRKECGGNYDGLA